MQKTESCTLVITHMLHYARDSFTAEVAKHAEKASFISLCGLSVLCGEIWVITSCTALTFLLIHPTMIHEVC